jgi:hypothetical protein
MVNSISASESFPTVREPAPLPQGGWPVSALNVRIAAGFPSPAEDHAGKRIDVLEHLVKHPQATYHMHVAVWMALAKAVPMERGEVGDSF